LKIDRLILGDLETNCYVLRAEESAAECLIIDPGAGPDELIELLQGQQLKPVATVLTHGHADHIVGVTALRRDFPQTQVYIHRLDALMLTDAEANLSLFVGMVFTTEPADVLLEEGDTIDQAGIQLTVLHTPGHTPGGICLHEPQEGLLFVGDTLFAGSVGRADFPGGDEDQLIESIRAKLLPLPDATAVYPGHGMRTTIGREKRTNPYIRMR
jgi:glyoxylase-like metal-dependent hydrolase (beta-lactamase superfamily II)